MQLTKTHLITLSAFAILSATAQASLVGVGDKSGSEVLESLPKDVYQSAVKAGKAQLAAEVDGFQKKVDDVKAVTQLAQGVYNGSPLSNIKRADLDNVATGPLTDALKTFGLKLDRRDGSKMSTKGGKKAIETTHDEVDSALKKDGKKSAPEVKKDEKKSAPEVTKDEKKSAPEVKKDEKKSAPEVKKDEKKVQKTGKEHPSTRADKDSDEALKAGEDLLAAVGDTVFTTKKYNNVHHTARADKNSDEALKAGEDLLAAVGNTVFTTKKYNNVHSARAEKDSDKKHGKHSHHHAHGHGYKKHGDKKDGEKDQLSLGKAIKDVKTSLGELEGRGLSAGKGDVSAPFKDGVIGAGKALEKVAGKVTSAGLQNELVNTRQFDPAQDVEYLANYANGVAEEVTNANKRTTVLPPLEILPGAGLKAQEFTNNVKTGLADAAVKLYEAQPVFRRSEGKMRRQRQTQKQ